MGAFCRSKREPVFVFKPGRAEHTNSFGLPIVQQVIRAMGLSALRETGWHNSPVPH